MNITLKPDQEAFIHAKLQSGQYQSVDDVIQTALHLLDERDKAYEQWVIETREKVEVGLAELERGEGVPLEEVMSRLQTKIYRARETQG